MLAFALSLVNHSYMSVEEQPDYLAIHDSFAATEHGQVLGNNVRYSIYKPDDVSNQRWIELLGPDADNLRHLVSTYHLTEEFIERTEELQPGELSPRDKAILKIGAITHDEAESVPEIGDINYSHKTADHETAEQAAFREYLPRFHPDASPEVAELILEAADEVIFNRESRLGRIFNAVERIGYLRVAMRASGHLHEGSAPECADGLTWLVTDTISNHHTTHLIAAGRRFPATHRFLEIHQPELERMFDVGYVGRLTSFAKFDPDRATVKEAHFDSACNVWDSWGGEFTDTGDDET